MENIKDLEGKIIRYAQSYYNGNPEISDNEFDKLVLQLKALNPSSEVLTTGWGYNPETSPLEKRDHLYGKLEGIGRKPSPESVEKITRFATCKLDGASVGLYYVDGKLDFALSRGNGKVGLDVTDKLSRIAPVHINESFNGRVRGEFILPREIFDSKYKPRGMKSPRNVASGMLTSKYWDPKDLQDIIFVAYTVTYEDGYTPAMADCLNILKKLGFRVANNTYINSYEYNNEDLEKKLDSIRNHDGHDLDCDGLVCQDDNGLFAIKWNIETAISTVTNVRWQQSRLGKLTPVVEIEPVELQDATIRKCSGFNRKYIEDNGIGKGSVVSITRSGDIIPYITEVISSTEAEIPEFCPTCGAPLVNDGVDIVCNNPSCSKTSVSRILNFINIVAPVDGLGSSIIKKYLEYIQVDNLETFVYRTVGESIDYRVLNGFKESSDGIGSSAVEKISEMNSKIRSDIPANKFLCGLGLKGLGMTYADKLFKDKYSFEDFIRLVSDNNFKAFDCLNVTGRKSLEDSRDLVISLSNKLNIVDIISYETVQDLPVCITGKLSKSRKDFLEEIKDVGAYEVPIAKAKILITDNPNGTSSKNKYANEHGIEKMSEEEFRQRYMK